MGTTTGLRGSSMIWTGSSFKPAKDFRFYDSSTFTQNQGGFNFADSLGSSFGGSPFDSGSNIFGASSDSQYDELMDGVPTGATAEGTLQNPNDIRDNSTGEFKPFSDSSMGTVAGSIFSDASNNNTRPVAGTLPTAPTEATLPTLDQQTQTIYDSGATPTEVVNQIGDLYGDDTDGARDVILRGANDRELTAEQIADNYDSDGDGNGFPLDVLIKILTQMPDNQDAVDILARSPMGGPPGAFDADGQVPGTGLPGSGDPGAGDGPGDGPGDGLGIDPGGNSPDDPDIPPDDPGITPDDPVIPETPEIPEIPTEQSTTGGGMGLFDSLTKQELEIEREADQQLRGRAQSLLGSENANSSLLNRLNQSYSPYTDPRFASLNQDQRDLGTLVRNNYQNIPGKDIFDAAKNYATGISPINLTSPTATNVGTSANTLTTGGRQNIQDIVAGQFAGSNLDQYINPYNRQVVDTALGDIERARQMQNLQNNSAATLAGAYGGDRAALVNTETNRAALDASARVAADLRSRGFDQAAALYGQDADRTMDADIRNQAADATTVRDGMSLAAQLAANNQEQDRLAQSQTALNQLAAGDNLLQAFGQGTDAYRDYVGDFAALGERDAARAQRELDFDFNEYLQGYAYDDQMINNLLKMFQVSPQNQKEIRSFDENMSGDLKNLIGLPEAFNDGLTGLGNVVDGVRDGYGFVKGLGDPNKLFG